MRRASLITLLVLTIAYLDTTSAMGQMFPRGGRRGGYGGYDGYGYDFGVTYDLSTAGNAARYTAQADRLAGERAATQQQAAMQSRINATMASNVASRQQAIYSQQQSARDWWFQAQQQQMSQQRAMSYGAGYAASTGIEAAASKQEAKATNDIIQWAPILYDPRFAEDRAKIEAPYRRAPKGLSVPTPDDYKTMIETVGHMKATLKTMTGDLTAQEYLDADAFLDQLAGEAKERLAKTEEQK